MYAKLKQLMTEKGYTVSEGDGWSASDSAEFNTFAHFILGVPFSEAHKMISHPTMFEKEWAVVNGSADIDPPQPMAAPIAPIDPPQPMAAPIDPPVEEGAPLVFDVTPEGEPAPPIEPTGDEGQEEPKDEAEESEGGSEGESEEGASDESEEA